MTEDEAFLRQARSDFAVFGQLGDEDPSKIPECQPLHFLQMACEKLAKACVLRTGDRTLDRHSHVAFSQLPYILNRRHIAAALGWQHFRMFQAFLRRTAPLFRQVDELHPSVGSQGGMSAAGPNVEYPWQGRNPEGELTWVAPADHAFGLLPLLRRPGDGAHLLQVIRLLLSRFEAVLH